MTRVTNQAFADLAQYFDSIRTRPITQLFESDPKRFERFSTKAGPFLFDWSKTSIDDQARAKLIELARVAQVEAKRDAMFAGEAINTTEKRAVLHTALRRFDGEHILVDGHNVMPDIAAERKQML